MDKKNAFIIYERYYDFNSDKIVAGGVQTYITNLIPLLNRVDYNCIVFQFSEKDVSERVELPSCKIYSIANTEKDGICKIDLMMKQILMKIDKENDLLIFADHILTYRNDVKHTLSIQHGIHWDIRKEKSRSNLKMFLSKARFAYNEHMKMKYVKHVVCVDYNFLNWYRAQVDVPNSNFTVIPNFTKISEVNEKSDEVIRIIFARRFVKHRGTHVFVDAINHILEEYSNVEVTVAGRGPEEKFLHQKLDKWSDKVSFMQYSSEQSLDIHANKNIAVVPTVGSEGTSLSLLEAMSAQCAVICTDVGGMTNIILNNYNGIMVEAGNAEQLYCAIKELIDNPIKRNLIAKRGYETVKEAFSYEQWSKKWLEVLKYVGEDNHVKKIN